jgi:hypothetical protein
MTAVNTDQPAAETTTDAQEEAKRRFRVVEFLSRTGSRASKRAVAAGRGAKNLTASAGRKTWAQIVEPYSLTKQILTGISLVSLGVLMWYLTAVVLIAIAGATGSWMLAIIGAVAFYSVFARFIYMPVGLMMMGYFGNAAEYKRSGMGMSIRRPVGSFA